MKRKQCLSLVKFCLDLGLQGVGFLWFVIQNLGLIPYTAFRILVPKQDKRRKSHPISKFLRPYLEKSQLQRAAGLGMAIMVLTANLVIKPINAFDMAQDEAGLLPEPEETVITQTVFAKPLEGRLCQGFHRWHPAIDICAPFNTPIKAIEAGEVIEAAYSRLGWGNTVVIKHQVQGQEYWSRYAHLNKIKVQVGDWVERETEIGTIGMTGWTTGPHLHLELRLKSGQPLNPAEYLPSFNYQLANKSQ